MKRNFNYRALKPSPMRGRGTALAVDEVKTASAVAPMRGRGTASRWMRCQPRRRTLLIPLSVTSDSDLTANLSPALRAARVNAVCPSEAAVRAFKGVEG